MLPATLTNVSFANIVKPADDCLCKELAGLSASESDASQIVPSILQCSLNTEYNFSKWLSCIKEQASNLEFFNHLELYCKKVNNIPIDQPCWSPLVKAIVRLTGPQILEKEKFVPIVKVFQSGLTSSNPTVRHITWSTWLYLSQQTLSHFSSSNYSPLIMKLLVLPLNKVAHRLTAEPREFILLKLDIVKELLRVCAPLNFDASYRIIETTLKLFYGSEISTLCYAPDICTQITELYLDMLQYSETSSCTVLLTNVLDKALVCLLHSVSPSPTRNELLMRVWTQACHHFKEVRCPTLYMDTVKSEMVALYTRFSPLLSPGLPSSPGSTVNRDFIPMKMISSLALAWELTGEGTSQGSSRMSDDLSSLPRNLEASSLLEMLRVYITEHEESKYLVYLVCLLCREEILLCHDTKLLPTLLTQLKNKIRPEYVTSGLFVSCVDIMESYRQSSVEQSDLWTFLVTYYTELVNDDVIKISQPQPNDDVIAHRLLLFPLRLNWSEKLSKVWRKVYAGLVNSAALENPLARDSEFSLQLLSKVGEVGGLETSRVQLLFSMLTHTTMGGYKEVSKQVQDHLVSLLHSTSSASTLDVAVSLCFTSVSRVNLIAPLVAELNHRISDESGVADRALTTKIIKLQRDVKQFRSGESKPGAVGSKSAVAANPRASSRFLQKLSQQQKQEEKQSKVTPSSPAQNIVSKDSLASPTPNRKDKSKLNTSVHEDGDTQDYVFIPPTTDPVVTPLTQHQKDKLKHRPSDIPALYQDLSQSSMNSQDVNSQDSHVLPVAPIMRGNLDVDENAVDVFTPEVEETLNEINIENQINRCGGGEDLSAVVRKREMVAEDKVTTRRSLKRNNENQAEKVQKDDRETLPTIDIEENTNNDRSSARKSVSKGGKVERSRENNVKTRKSLLKENSGEERSNSPIKRKQTNQSTGEEEKDDKRKRMEEEKSEIKEKVKKADETVNVRMSPRKREIKDTVDKQENKEVANKEVNEKTVPVKEDSGVRTPTRLSKRKCSSPFSTKDFIVDMPKKRRSALWSNKGKAESQSQDSEDSQEKQAVTGGEKEKTRQSVVHGKEQLEKKSHKAVKMNDDVDEALKAPELVPCDTGKPRKSILKSNKVIEVDTARSVDEDLVTCDSEDVVAPVVNVQGRKNLRKSILKLPRASDVHVVTRKSVKFHAKIARSNTTVEEQKSVGAIESTKTEEVAETGVEIKDEVENKVETKMHIESPMETDEPKPELKPHFDEASKIAENNRETVIEGQKKTANVHSMNKTEEAIVSTNKVSIQDLVDAKNNVTDSQAQDSVMPVTETEKVSLAATENVTFAAPEKKSINVTDKSLWTTIIDPDKTQKCLNVSRVELNIRKKTIQEIYKHIHLYRSNEVTISDIDRILINREPLKAYEQFKNQILYNSIKFLLSDNIIYAVTDVTLKKMFGPNGGLHQNNTTVGLQHCTIVNNTTIFGNETLAKSFLHKSEKFYQNDTMGTTLGPVATYRHLNADTKLGSRFVNHMLVKKNVKNSFNFISNFNFILLSHPVDLNMEKFNLSHLWSSEQLSNMLEYFRGLNSVPIFLITVLTGDKNFVDKKFKTRLADKLKRLSDLDKYFVKYLDFKDWTYKEDLAEDFNIYEAETTLIRIENVKFNFYIEEDNDTSIQTETILLEATAGAYLEETKQGATNLEETKHEKPEVREQDQEKSNTATNLPVIAKPEKINNKSITTLAHDITKHVKTQSEVLVKEVVNEMDEPVTIELKKEINSTEKSLKPISDIECTPSPLNNQTDEPNDEVSTKLLEANIMIKPVQHAKIAETHSDITKIPEAQIKSSPSKIRTIPAAVVDIPDTQDESIPTPTKNKISKPSPVKTTAPAKNIVIPNTQQDDEKVPDLKGDSKDVPDMKEDNQKLFTVVPDTQQANEKFTIIKQDDEKIPVGEQNKTTDIVKENEKIPDPQDSDKTGSIERDTSSDLDVIESSQESSHLELRSPKHSSTKIFAHSTPFPSKVMSGASSVRSFKSSDDFTSDPSSRSADTLNKPVLESTDEAYSNGAKSTHSPRRSGFSGSPRVSRICPPLPHSPPRHSIATPPRSPHKTNEETRRGKKTTPPQQSSLGGRGAAMLELLESSGGGPHPPSSLRKRLTPTRLSSPQESPKSSRRSSRMLSLVQCAAAPPSEEGCPHTSPPGPHTPRQTRWIQQHWTPGRTPTSGILRPVTTSGKKKLKVNFMEHPVSEELHFDKNKETLDNSLHILYNASPLVIGKKLQFQDPTEDDSESTREKLTKLATSEEKIRQMKAAISDGKQAVQEETDEDVGAIEEKMSVEEKLAVQVIGLVDENCMDVDIAEDSHAVKAGDKIKERTENQCEDNIARDSTCMSVRMEQLKENVNIEETNDDNINESVQECTKVDNEDKSASFVETDIQVGDDSSITTADFQIHLRETYFGSLIEEQATMNETTDALNGSFEGTRTEQNKVVDFSDELKPSNQDVTAEISETPTTSQEEDEMQEISQQDNYSQETSQQEDEIQEISQQENDTQEISQQEDTIQETSQQLDETTQKLNSFANDYDETFEIMEEIDEIMVSQEALEKNLGATLNDTFTIENNEAANGAEVRDCEAVEDNTVDRLDKNRENVHKLNIEQTQSNLICEEEKDQFTVENNCKLVDELIISKSNEAIEDFESIDNRKTNESKPNLDEKQVDTNGVSDLSNEDCSELKEKHSNKEVNISVEHDSKKEDNSEQDTPMDSEELDAKETPSRDHADEEDESCSLDASRLASLYASPLPSSSSSPPPPSQCHLTPTPPVHPACPSSSLPPLYPALLECHDVIDDVILSLLTFDGAQKNLLASCLAKLGIKTISHLASLTRLQANNLPLGKRREDTIVTALSKYESGRSQQPEEEIQQEEKSQQPEEESQQEEENQQEESLQEEKSQHMEQTCVQQRGDIMENIKVELASLSRERRLLAQQVAVSGELVQQVAASGELVQQANASRNLEDEIDDELEQALALAARLMETKRALKRKRLEQERQEHGGEKRRKL